MDREELLIKMLKTNVEILNIYRVAIGQTSIIVREKTLKPAIDLLDEFKDYLSEYELKANSKDSQ